MKVSKNARSLCIPEPRFQTADFPYRSSYLLESDDGVRISGIKLLELKVNISKKNVSRKLEELQGSNLLVTVFEDRQSVEGPVPIHSKVNIVGEPKPAAASKSRPPVEERGVVVSEETRSGGLPSEGASSSTSVGPSSVAVEVGSSETGEEI